MVPQPSRGSKIRSAMGRQPCRGDFGGLLFRVMPSEPNLALFGLEADRPSAGLFAVLHADVSRRFLRNRANDFHIRVDPSKLSGRIDQRRQSYRCSPTRIDRRSFFLGFVATKKDRPPVQRSLSGPSSIQFVPCDPWKTRGRRLDAVRRIENRIPSTKVRLLTIERSPVLVVNNDRVSMIGAHHNTVKQEANSAGCGHRRRGSNSRTRDH